MHQNNFAMKKKSEGLNRQPSRTFFSSVKIDSILSQNSDVKSKLSLYIPKFEVSIKRRD